MNFKTMSNEEIEELYCQIQEERKIRKDHALKKARNKIYDLFDEAQQIARENNLEIVLMTFNFGELYYSADVQNIDVV